MLSSNEEIYIFHETVWVEEALVKSKTAASSIHTFAPTRQTSAACSERKEILFDTAAHEWLIRDGFASRPAVTRRSIVGTSRSDC